MKIEQKRLGRRIAELKFRIAKVKQLPDSRVALPGYRKPAACRRGTRPSGDRSESRVALEIAEQDMGFRESPEKFPELGTYPNFMRHTWQRRLKYHCHAAEVKNRGGFIVEAIRENYQNSEVQKARQLRAEKAREKELEDLTAEFRVKRDTILRQAVHADPGLVEACRGENPILLCP